MKHFVLTLALALGIAGMTACQKSDSAGEKPASEQSKPVATIDGEVVTTEFFEFYAKTRSGKPSSELTEEQRKNLLDEIVRLELAAQTAVKNGLDQKPETASQLELQRLSVLADAAFKNHLDGKAPTEQELRAEYETQVAAMPKLEYRARHILVATEPFAQSIIDKLRTGADFAELARKESMDAKESGGDLGWFSPGRMVPEFANAVVALKKGETTQKPVQTQYGWHVIQLQETREVSPPDFDQVKERLGNLVQQKKVQAYVDELKKTAKIETTS
ncbi:MAG TPA: peptidylprolyl isomerase [Steroidobacteraceae bacterium]